MAASSYPTSVNAPQRALQLPFPRPGTRSARVRSIPRAGLGHGDVLDALVDDPGMAAFRAAVHLEGSRAIVSDLGGEPGSQLGQEATIRLNGEPLREPHPLVEGDVLRLGDTVLLYSTEGRTLSADEARPDGEIELTGVTSSIEAARRSVDAVAPHRRSVVITGETGTGKEIVARLLHRRSGRTGPFVAVNCGGFTEGLLASELFGHVRGAFTGAVTEQPGLFRAARGGTLFLDEAGDLPLSLQASLLRVLETWEVRPVGSARMIQVDVRVVAASNRDLLALVEQGRFRADLYARLAQWTIRLSPLRDRRADIPAISRALLAQLGAADRTLTPDLEEALLIHPWPLNVRGLANVLAVAAIATLPGQPLALGPEVRAALQDNRIGGAATPPAAVPPALDRESLEALLRRYGGRVTEAARHAGVSRPRFYRALWAAQLDPATFRTR